MFRTHMGRRNRTWRLHWYLNKLTLKDSWSMISFEPWHRLTRNTATPTIETNASEPTAIPTIAPTDSPSLLQDLLLLLREYPSKHFPQIRFFWESSWQAAHDSKEHRRHTLVGCRVVVDVVVVGNVVVFVLSVVLDILSTLVCSVVVSEKKSRETIYPVKIQMIHLVKLNNINNNKLNTLFAVKLYAYE